MREIRIALMTLVILFVSLPVVSAQNAPPVVRDSQALTVLQRCVAAFGGLAAIQEIQDFKSTGSIIYTWTGAPVTAPVTVVGKGLDSFRLDAIMPEGTRTLRFSGGMGSLTTEDGATNQLFYANLMNMGALTFPSLRILSALNTQTTSLTFVGQTIYAGGPVLQIHVSPIIDSSIPPPSGTSTFGAFDIFLDPNTYLAVAISDSFWPDHTTQTLRHEIRFSGYSTVSGISIPKNIAEILNGQELWSMQLSSTTFNNNPQDSFFKP